MSGCKTLDVTSEANENQDTIKSVDTILNDSVSKRNIVADTLENDTVLTQNNGSLSLDSLSKGDGVALQEAEPSQKQVSFIDDKIERSCNDSTIQDFKNNKIYYYGDAKVVYEDITIEAAFIEFDFENRTVFAQGLRDSTGKLYGAPVFLEGEHTGDIGTDF